MQRTPEELQTTSRVSDNDRVCSPGMNGTSDADTQSSDRPMAEDACHGAGAQDGRELPAVHVRHQFITTPEVEDAVKAMFTGAS